MMLVRMRKKLPSSSETVKMRFDNENEWTIRRMAGLMGLAWHLLIVCLSLSIILTTTAITQFFHFDNFCGGRVSRWIDGL